MQTAYGELLLNWLLRGDTLTPPSTWYFGLDVSLSGDPYTEPGYSGYARASLARSTSNWVSATGAGQIVSAAAITWPAPPGGYTAAEQVRRVFISDHSTPSGEHVLDFIELADNPILVDGGVPTLASGVLIIDAGDG